VVALGCTLYHRGTNPHPGGGMAYRETGTGGMAYREVYTPPTTSVEGMAYREVYTQPTTPANGYIQVSSTPSGATVIVDEYQRLSTPDIFIVPTDRYHTVQVQISGYQPYSQSVLVRSGQTATVSASLVKNAPVAGGLTVSSIPSGADIYIDGNYRGETASTIGGLSPGTHTLSLRKAGYHDASSTISITPGSVSSRSITLQKYQPKPAVGSIEVISDPPGALIYLDGNFQGTTHTGNPFDITGVAPGMTRWRKEKVFFFSGEGAVNCHWPAGNVLIPHACGTSRAGRVTWKFPGTGSSFLARRSTRVPGAEPFRPRTFRHGKPGANVRARDIR